MLGSLTLEEGSFQLGPDLGGEGRQLPGAPIPEEAHEASSVSDRKMQTGLNICSE